MLQIDTNLLVAAYNGILSDPNDYNGAIQDCGSDIMEKQPMLQDAIRYGASMFCHSQKEKLAYVEGALFALLLASVQDINNMELIMDTIRDTINAPSQN